VRSPRGLLLDYGGTLVEETAVDVRAGNEWLLSQASFVPPAVTIDDVLARVERVTREVSSRRDVVHLETPWPTVTRLIHDYFGIRFDRPLAELELGFWQASVTTREMPGAAAALERCRRIGLPVGVLSNSSFGAPVIRGELARHGLAGLLAFVLVSADYAVRKPSPLLFETAAARLGVAPADVWFVGDRLDTDIAGARAAGMTTVWFNPERRAVPDRSAIDLIAASWSDVIAALGTVTAP
jgi:putative hydrolase of the HAD superfamily